MALNRLLEKSEDLKKKSKEQNEILETKEEEKKNPNLLAPTIKNPSINQSINPTDQKFNQIQKGVETTKNAILQKAQKEITDLENLDDLKQKASVLKNQANVFTKKVDASEASTTIPSKKEQLKTKNKKDIPFQIVKKQDRSCCCGFFSFFRKKNNNKNNEKQHLLEKDNKYSMKR